MNGRGRDRKKSYLVNVDASAHKVQLFTQAKDLKNVAGLLKNSNPFAVVTELQAGSKSVVLGKTEVIQKCLNPAWVEAFYVQYKIGKPTTISISIYHQNDKDKNTKPMGSAIFEIGEILGGRGSTRAKKLKQGGVLYVTGITAPMQSSGNLVLSLQGVQLRNQERVGLSDPFYEVSRKIGTGRDDWHPVYRSKTVMNSLDPIWEPASIDLDRLCDANRDMPIRISVYDFEKNGAHKRMGWIECTVNILVKRKTERIKTFQLTKGKGIEDKEYGKIAVNDDTYIETSEGRKLDINENEEDNDFNITWEIKINDATYPLFEITRTLDDGSTKMTIFRSDYKKYKPSLTWDKVSIPMSKLCENDPGKIVTVSILDHDMRNDMNTLIAETDITIRALIEAESNNPNEVAKIISLYAAAKRMKNSKTGKGKVVGKIRVIRANITNTDRGIISLSAFDKKPKEEVRRSSISTRRDPTFLDYIGGGCELRMCVAVDFSRSNGFYHSPSSLHYLNPSGELNDYEKAIARIGSILSKYDHKHDIPVWGFGAKINGVEQNCFQLGRGEAIAHGVKEIIRFYRDYVSMKVPMAQKAIVKQIVENAKNYALWESENAMKEKRQAYTVLVILTDGDLSELARTKKAIGMAGDAPLSIVIVGIGDGDFSDMHMLDELYEGDDGKGRDITQFVEFNAHKDEIHSLSSEILDEIPFQVVEYFQSKGIHPLPPSETGIFDLEPDDVDDDFVLDLKFNERNNDLGVCRVSEEKIVGRISRQSRMLESSLEKIGKEVDDSDNRSIASMSVVSTVFCQPKCCL